jgi:hypothetical protein
MMLVMQGSRYYPEFGIARLTAQHGRRWADLVAWVAGLPGSDPQVMAFTRTLRQVARTTGIRANYHDDPFCATCAADVMDRYPGSEDDLLRLYSRNLREIAHAIKTMRRREVIPQTRVATA